MAFRDFSEYIFEFKALDNKLPNKKDQVRYYNKWMKNYSEIFVDCDNFVGMEWDLRCRKSLREIFSSATFFVEAQKTLEMKCFSSYYFCLYYALFHAIYAVLFMDSNLTIDKLLNITHRNIINLFHSSFCNSKKDILSLEVKDSFNSLKYRREYYSYVTPFNNIFDYSEDIKSLQTILSQCYQLGSLHSLLICKSYDKKIGKVTKFKTESEVYEFNELFNKLFSKNDNNGYNKLDASSETLRDELMRWGFKPEYFVLDLEHQYDEFHTYDSFYNGDEEYALNINDIWSFIYGSIM